VAPGFFCLNEMETTLIHFGEFTLKGKNRSDFVNQLARNIKLKTNGIVHVYRNHIVLEDGNRDQLQNIWGISWYACCSVIKKNYKNLEHAVLDEIKSHLDGNKTFAVFVKRSDKRFEYNSLEISRKLGSLISNSYNICVNLKTPDIPVYIEISDQIYLFFQKTNGLRGLPVGVSGKLLTLLSGGIDSPVGSLLMMKRGCNIDYMHFHAFPDSITSSNSKIIRTVKILKNFQSNSTIYLFPYKYFDIEIMKLKNVSGYEMVLFRRFMLKIAGLLVDRYDYKGVVTGDSLGQVASQTLENLYAFKHDIPIQLYQPLISFDKQQIIDLAKNFGTYEVSIESYKDCCSIISSNPKTKAKINIIRELERQMETESLIEKTFKELEVIQI